MDEIGVSVPLFAVAAYCTTGAPSRASTERLHIHIQSFLDWEIWRLKFGGRGGVAG